MSINNKNISDIKDTISKLLALADSPNEHEAKAALLKARELMAKYKLHPDEAVGKKDSKLIKREIGVFCTKTTNSWAICLSAVISEHYCCGAYRHHKYGAKKVEIGLVGLEDDFEICEKIFKYAYDCVAAQCKEIRAKHKGGWPIKIIRQMESSYGFGFCEGLKSAYKKQDSEHKEYGLVLVTPKAVAEAFNAMGEPVPYGNASCEGRGREFAQRGYQDGMEFNPSLKLE